MLLYLYKSFYSTYSVCIQYRIPNRIYAPMHIEHSHCGYITVTQLVSQQWTITFREDSSNKISVRDFHIPNTGWQCAGGHLKLMDALYCGKRMPWDLYINGEDLDMIIDLWLVKARHKWNVKHIPSNTNSNKKHLFSIFCLFFFFRLSFITSSHCTFYWWVECKNKSNRFSINLWEDGTQY